MRVGLAVVALAVPEWVFALASALVAGGDVELSLVLVGEANGTGRRHAGILRRLCSGRGANRSTPLSRD